MPISIDKFNDADKVEARVKPMHDAVIRIATEIVKREGHPEIKVELKRTWATYQQNKVNRRNGEITNRVQFGTMCLNESWLDKKPRAAYYYWSRR